MIKVIGKKTLYNLDNERSLKQWSKDPVKKLKTYDVPNLSSGIKIKEKNGLGKNFKDSIGYMMVKSNNVGENSLGVALFTTAYSNAHGFGINKDNFILSVALFSARRLIQTNWTNWTDEYMAPDESHPKYKEYINDSIIYSLFESASNQSSLRNIDYKNNENNNE